MGVWLVAIATFLFFQSKTIFGGDGGDLVSAICVNGVAHPPGYPLYTLLGRWLYFLPFYTPAWRVALLSSLPAATVVALVFHLVWQLTKDRWAAFIGAFTLAFSYFFWLYAEVPEAFSLNNLFLISLTVITLNLIEKFDDKKLKLWFLVAGFSVSHHHFSIWFYPVFVFFIYWFNQKYWQKNFIKKIAVKLPYFFLGLLPYLYVPLSARNYPVISWNNAHNLKNFWQLFTRAGYGTFLSHSASLKVGLGQRLFLVYGQFLSISEYFGWLGILLLGLGFIYLYRQKNKAFWLMLGLFVWQLVFIFYSGFGLSTKAVFGVAVYGRFLLPGMVWGGVLIGCGLFYLVTRITQWLTERFEFHLFKPEQLRRLFLLTLLLYPLGLFLKNYPVFKELKDDFTAENYAKDILQTAPKDSLLLLSFDNPLFNSQYVHYCLNERPDLKLLHLSLIERGYFQPILKSNYADLVLPEKGEENFIEKLLELNYQKREIYTNNMSYFESGAFIPTGLLYRYYPSEKEIPSLDEVYENNQEIWEQYHDPLSGILSWFQPLTLAAILDDYVKAAQDSALLFYQSGMRDEAQEFFDKIQYFRQSSEEFDVDSVIKQNLEEEKKRLLNLD